MILRAMLAAAILFGSAAAKTERFGIFAGHNLGRNREPLRFAERDAERVAGVFRELGGMEAANMRVLRAPDREGLEAAFRDLEARARALPRGVDAVFFLYFSGHGDERSLVLGNQELPLDDVKARFDAFPAKLRVGLFDACQSGAITRIKGARVIDPFVRRTGVNGEGNIYITSSSGDENSQEADHLEASFFTHHLTSALRGAADVSGDRKVTLMEAYNYAFNHTVAETGGTRGGTQHPNARFRMDVEGDIVLTDVGSASSGIRFGKRSAGEFLILDGNASVMAEVNKDPRTEVMVALEPGEYAVFMKEGRKVRRASIRLGPGQILALEEAAMSVHEGGEGKVKGWSLTTPETAGGEPTGRWRSPPRPGFLGTELGMAYESGGIFWGGLSLAPVRPVVLHLQYGYRDRRRIQLHEIKAGLELYHPFLASHLFARGFFNLGRADDEYETQQVVYRYRCADWDNPGNETLNCSRVLYEDERIYRTVFSASADLGARFFLHRHLAFQLTTGLIYGFQEVGDYFNTVMKDGMELKPFGLGVQAWF